MGRALLLAGNIAGAASLAVTADAAAQKQSIRDGVADFLVNSLDEALRILKNEVRKREPVAVCVAPIRTPSKPKCWSGASCPICSRLIRRTMRPLRLEDAAFSFEAAPTTALLRWSVASPRRGGCRSSTPSPSIALVRNRASKRKPHGVGCAWLRVTWAGSRKAFASCAVHGFADAFEVECAAAMGRARLTLRSQIEINGTSAIAISRRLTQRSLHVGILCRLDPRPKLLHPVAGLRRDGKHLSSPSPFFKAARLRVRTLPLSRSILVATTANRAPRRAASR